MYVSVPMSLLHLAVGRYHILYSQSSREARIQLTKLDDICIVHRYSSLFTMFLALNISSFTNCRNTATWITTFEVFLQMNEC